MAYKRAQSRYNMMKLTLISTLICLLLASLLVFTQSTSLRPAIQKLVNSIAKTNVVMGSAVGEAGSRPAQWDEYINLTKAATSKELIELTDNASGVVRCYAFQALANRKDKNIFNILLSHLNDTARIETLFGCTGGTIMVGDYFVDVVTPGLVDPESQKRDDAEKSVLDSILLFDKHINLVAKSQVLNKLSPLKKFYQRVREITVSENTPEAILALAKYKNKNDVSIIARFLKDESLQFWGIQAAREFPDKTFYPELVQVFENEWNKEKYDYPLWRVLYQALAKYPEEKTSELFDRTIQSTDVFRRNTLGVYLLVALNRYPDTEFASIKSRIKLAEPYLEEYSFEMERD